MHTIIHSALYNLIYTLHTHTLNTHYIIYTIQYTDLRIVFRTRWHIVERLRFGPCAYPIYSIA